MPFDSDVISTPVRRPLDLNAVIETVQAPDAAWATAHPERALAFLMCAPRPCAAMEAL